ncbi:hypothetical protein [Streptomyces erythrochromogenes]
MSKVQPHAAIRLNDTIIETGTDSYRLVSTRARCSQRTSQAS